MKDNKCEIMFYCDDKDGNCVYFKKTSNNKICKYSEYLGFFYICKSAVANVNRIYLKIEELQGKKENIKIKGETNEKTL